MAADHIVQQCRVEHGAGDGADLVERGGEGDRTITGHPAVGRLDAHRTGDGSGLADGSTGVGAQREGRFKSGDRGSRTTAGATGDAVEVPRVVGGPEGGVFGG